jgi:hypothetical protein
MNVARSVIRKYTQAEIFKLPAEEMKRIKATLLTCCICTTQFLPYLTRLFINKYKVHDRFNVINNVIQLVRQQYSYVITFTSKTRAATSAI